MTGWPHETQPGRCTHWPKTCAEVQAATPTCFKPCAHCWPAGWGLPNAANQERQRIQEALEGEIEKRIEEQKRRIGIAAHGDAKADADWLQHLRRSLSRAPACASCGNSRIAAYGPTGVVPCPDCGLPATDPSKEDSDAPSLMSPETQLEEVGGDGE